MKKTTKRTTKRTWYRKPQHEIIDEYLLVDGEQTISIIVSTKGKSPWRTKPNEKVFQLIDDARSLGLKFLGEHRTYEEIPGIKTKAVQEEEYALEEFRKAIFYECGAQQYL